MAHGSPVRRRVRVRGLERRGRAVGPGGRRRAADRDAARPARRIDRPSAAGADADRLQPAVGQPFGAPASVRAAAAGFLGDAADGGAEKAGAAALARGRDAALGQHARQFLAGAGAGRPVRAGGADRGAPGGQAENLWRLGAVWRLFGADLPLQSPGISGLCLSGLRDEHEDARRNRRIGAPQASSISNRWRSRCWR